MAQFLVHLRRYFLTGLLVITPIWGTYLILKTLLVALDGIAGNILQRYLVFYLPGLGIVVLLALILLVGILATNFLGRKLVQWWDAVLHRVPIVRPIYLLMKSIVDALSLQQKNQFSRVVLIEFPRQGHYSIAYVTGTPAEVQHATGERVLSVYVPTTPNPTSGYLLFVPEREVIPLSMSVEDSMKLIISGGLFSPKAPAREAPAGTRG
ncbi:MAG: DUF502 domain-containing protein [Nitrospirota bacterium]